MGQGLASGRKVVLRSDSRGHFRDSGFINNKPMQYMVDTGASVIGIGQPMRSAWGLDYQKAAPSPYALPTAIRRAGASG